VNELWRSALTSECPDVKNYKWRFNLVWHRMFYSCTHMATVGVKELRIYSLPHVVFAVAQLVCNTVRARLHRTFESTTRTSASRLTSGMLLPYQSISQPTTPGSHSSHRPQSRRRHTREPYQVVFITALERMAVWVSRQWMSDNRLTIVCSTVDWSSHHHQTSWHSLPVTSVWLRPVLPPTKTMDDRRFVCLSVCLSFF